MLFTFLYILLNAAEKLKVVLFLYLSFINFIRKNLNPANSKSDPVYYVEKPNQ